MVEGGFITYQFDSDEEGRIISIVGRHGGTLSISYVNGHISRVADVLENAVAFTYEGEHLVSVTNPKGNSMSFAYNGDGKLRQILDFAGKTYLTNQYDYLGRVVVQHITGRGETLASYDEVNRATIFTDELGNATKYTYDENLNVTKVELADTAIQSKYNDKGQLTEQVDGIGNVTRMAYDTYGRMNHITYPDGTEEQIFYNAGNYPFKVINRDETIRLYGYDAARLPMSMMVMEIL